MPQEHYVLRCFSCETFQVHIVKKSSKWECKICRAKQSVKRNYGKGSGKDCRNQVMKLNELRIKKCNDSNEAGEEFEEALTEEVKELSPEKKTVTSKWLKYMDDDKTDGESEVEDDLMNINNQILPRKRRESRKCNKRRKICDESNEVENSTNTSKEQNNEFLDYKKELEKRGGDENLVFQSEITRKPGKYSKYLEDEDEPVDNLLGKVTKSSNIFDSESTDLDSILNF